MSDEHALRNFTVRLSIDDQARLSKLKASWGLDRSAALRRLIRQAVPSVLNGREPLFTQITNANTGSVFTIRLKAAGGHREPE